LADNRLTAQMVKQTKEPGYHGDGGGLVLRVTDNGVKGWLYRYKANGKTREMGLGPVRDVSLAEAREAAREARRLRRAGIDPIVAKRARKDAAKLEAAKAVTFTECADDYIKAHRASWTSAKHAEQWETTLRTYAYPVFGSLPVMSVDTALVVKVLDPIWSKKPETASRLRGRIESVLDFATVRGYRTGENPARWKGHLKEALPAISRVRRVKHHAAMPYTALPAFMTRLRTRGGVGALALEFCILTVARSGEVFGARWSEIDMLAGVWTIPGSRMKARVEHRVPLSAAALAVLRRAEALKVNDVVFPGQKPGRGLSDIGMSWVLEAMGHNNITTHGFRSSFRDWAAERTTFQREVIEVALAHAVGDKTERAYARGDLFEKRRELMSAWAGYCGGSV
jgi:integrase